jgi:hypothetical protein
VIDAERRLLKVRNARHASRHLRESCAAHGRGKLCLAEFDARVQDWIGHAGHADT